MNIVTIFKQAQHRLINTNMSLHSGDQHLSATGILQGLKKVRFTTTAEADFFNNCLIAGGSQLRDSMTNTFRILLRSDNRDTKQTGDLNQHGNRIAQAQINILRHSRHQALLDIDHYQNCFLRI